MKKTTKAILLVTSLSMMIFVALWGLKDALTPLLISFAISYLVFPLIKKLEKRNIERNYAVLGVFIFLVTSGLLTFALIVPNLVSDAQDLLEELPNSSSKSIQKIEVIAADLGYEIDLSRDSVARSLRFYTTEFSREILKALSKGIQSSFTGISSWIIAILNLFLIPLFFFYVINDYERISNELKSFIPSNIQPKLSYYSSLNNQIMSGYIRGQLMVALILGILYAFGLSLVGLKFGVLIGLFCGLISIIPYAGFFIGIFVAMTMALANYTGINIIVGVSAVFIIVQLLEGFVITPKLVGDKVGLSALATILALIIGGNILGLMGMIIAIPIAALCKHLFKDLKAEILKMNFYKNGTNK